MKKRTQVVSERERLCDLWHKECQDDRNVLKEDKKKEEKKKMPIKRKLV